MKILVVSNQKGGVGKSTLVVHLAHFAAEAGSRVLAVDLDPQRTSTYSLEHYATGTKASELFADAPLQVQSTGGDIDLIEADIGLVDLDRAPLEVMEAFAKQLASLSDRYDLCVIDTAPAAGLRMVAALTSADYVVSPIELESYSIHGITSMLQTIFGVKQRWNAKLEFLGMLPSRFNSHSPSQKAALNDLLKQYPKLVLPHAIALRTAIGDALTERIPVWRLKKTSAREAGREMKAALGAITERIGGLT